MKAAILLALIIVVSGCVQQQPSKEIKIGISTLLSGDYAALGQNIVNTAELALDEIPHEGLNISFVVEDSKCGRGEGIKAATKLAEIDRVQVIIGGTCSDDTMSAAPYVNEKKVIYITPVTGGRNIDNAGEYVFRTGNSDILAGRQPAEDFIKKFNFTKAALATEQREYTIDIRDNFRERFEELGGETVIDEVFEPNANDFRTLILKIKESKPDAILLSSQIGTTGGYFIKQASELDLDVPIFTTFTTVTNENARQIAGEAMDGIYFYDPDYDVKNPELTAFFEKYKKRYGKGPFIPFHSAATYDSIRMSIEAIKNVGYDGEKIHDWLLQNVKNRSGFMGTFSFDKQGNTNNGFALKVVKNGTFLRVE